MHQQIRQDLVIDVSGFLPEQRDRLFDMQMGILAAKYHEADADHTAAQARAISEAECAKRAAVCREQEEIKLAEQRKAQVQNQKYCDLVENREHEYMRPSRTHFVEINYNDERKLFVVTYCGISAYGDTPEMACDNFDHLWLYGESK